MDCFRVDLAVPAAREQIARWAVSLHETGINRIQLSNLPPMAGRTLTDLVGAVNLALFKQIAVPFHPMMTDLDVTLVLEQDTISSPAPCNDIFALARPLCVTALNEAALDQAPEDVSPPEPQTLAWQLAEHWHWAQKRIIDMGPIWTTYETEAEFRQAVAITALSGGMYMLSGNVTQVGQSGADIFFAPIRHNAIHPARPVSLPKDRVPAVWASSTTLAIFNWDTQVKEYPIPVEWQTISILATDVFDGSPVTLGSMVAVQPHDVLFLVR
jgi:hypothetical protein